MIQSQGKIRTEVIYDMPESEYYALPYMAATQLKIASSDGLAKLRKYLDGASTGTKAQRIGWLAHMRVNSPSDWANVMYPPASMAEGIETADGKAAKKPKQTKAYEERLIQWELEHPRAIRVTEEEYLETERIADALLRSTCYQEPTATEIVVLFDFLGEQAKCRVDGELAIGDGTYWIYDWKFVAGTRNFNSKVFDYRYHMQMAFYREAYRSLGREVPTFINEEGVECSRCYLVAIDKETADPSYTVCAPVSEEDMQLGLRECQYWLGRIREARASGYWPGVESPGAWRRPGFYKSPCLDWSLVTEPDEAWTP